MDANAIPADAAAATPAEASQSRADARKPGAGLADLVVPLAIAAAFLAVAATRLTDPPEYLFDEVYHAGSARSFIIGKGPFDLSHPPLAKLLIAAGGAAAGREAAAAADARFLAAARTPGLLMAVLALLFMYGLCRTLTRSRLAAALACLLLATDTMFLLFARTAMTNIYLVAFALGGSWALVVGARSGRRRWFVLAGIAFGLAAASRWTGIALALACGGMAALRLAWDALPHEQRTRPSAKAVGLALRAPVAPLALAAGTALVVYVLSYAPLVATSGSGPWYSALTRFEGRGSWASALAAQGTIVRAHLSPTTPSEAQSQWWSWPLLLDPAWFFFETRRDEPLRAVLATGNPFIWWASVPFLVLAAAVAVRRRRWGAAYAALPALSLWLVWGARRAQLGYLHYYFETAVFAVPVIAWWVTRGARDPTAPPRARALARAAVAAYAAGAIAWAAVYHPLVTAGPLSPDGYLSRLLYGERWDIFSRLWRFREEHGLQDEAAWQKYREDFQGARYRRNEGTNLGQP